MSKTVRNFVQALGAVVVGNAAYFLLMPHLPAGVRHIPFRFDAGIVLDFGLCMTVFAVIRVIFG